ncbi:MAG: DUF697 domain-containing protein [Gloeocapsa sp. UFS-A4-WI-NPMV-4B04]|jgi:hypothetical protein|nr:DUF697 domain-containing protein [Gloeocapsa sp. UFS-A4-WI-NPMV-4B04]
MAVKLRRPILVGGVGLSFSLLVLQSFHQSIDQLGEFSVIGIIALGICLWLFQHQVKNTSLQLDKAPTDRATVEKVIVQVEGIVSQIATEAENQGLSPLQEKIEQLKVELNRQEIHLAITGGKAVGKTTLMQLLFNVGQQPLDLQETPALFTGTDTITTDAALEQAIAQDLVLFVTNGDLTDTQFQAINQLTAANQRLMLVFNKQDQYLPDERASVLCSLRQRMYPTLKAEDVVAITASPTPVKVRQHQADGTVQEWMEQPAIEITQLTQQLTQVLTEERQQLVWATTNRKAVALKAEAKAVLNQVRRDRALPIIEQYQWIAAAAAFANPVPALDLLATAAINAQLVMDLGGIYQQRFSLQQAQTVAGTMGSLMLKLGLVELSSKAIGTVLKSNAITFVAGGAVQGVSAAYLTRLAGLSLIEYFQQQEVTTPDTKLNIDKLGQTLQNVFQQNQQIGFLPGFVKQTVNRILPESQTEINVSQTVA